MLDLRARHADELASGAQPPVGELAVLGGAERRVEPADRGVAIRPQREIVRREEPEVAPARMQAIERDVDDRLARRGADVALEGVRRGPAAQRLRRARERVDEGGEPAAIGHAVVVDEGEDLAGHHARAGVARGGRTRVRLAQQARARTGRSRGRRGLRRRIPAVVDDDDLVALRRVVLARERLETGPQRGRAAAGRNDDRYERQHRGNDARPGAGGRSARAPGIERPRHRQASATRTLRPAAADSAAASTTACTRRASSNVAPAGAPPRTDAAKARHWSR